MMDLSRHSFFSKKDYLPVYQVYDFVGNNELIPTLDSIVTQYDVAVSCKLSGIEWRINPTGASERFTGKWNDMIEVCNAEVIANIKELIEMEPSMSMSDIEAALRYGNMSYIDRFEDYVNQPVRGIW